MEFKIAVIGDHVFGDRSLLSDSPNVEIGEGEEDEELESTHKEGFYDWELMEVLRGKGTRDLKQSIQIESRKKSFKLSNSRELA